MEKLQKRLKLRIKKGDNVQVIAGDAKGKTGVVLSVDPTTNRAIVEGLNIVKRHRKPSPQDPQSGGIIEKEAPIHISNLMVLSPKSNKPTRIGYTFDNAGKKQRVFKADNK